MKALLILSSFALFVSATLAFVASFVRDYILRVKSFDHRGFSKAVSDTITNSIINSKAWMYAWFSGMQRSPTVA